MAAEKDTPSRSSPATGSGDAKGTKPQSAAPGAGKPDPKTGKPDDPAAAGPAKPTPEGKGAASGSAGGTASGTSAAGASKPGKPLTIDLTATEKREQSARTAAGTVPPTSKPGTGPGAGPATGDRPSAGGAASARPSESKAAAATGRGVGMGGLFGAALLGGAVALGGAWMAQQAGWLPAASPAGGSPLRAELEAAEERISALDARLAELAGSEASPTVAPSLVNELQGRVDALEQAASSGAASEQELAAVRDGLAELRRFVSAGGAGSSAALASLGDTLEKLQQQVGTLSEEVQAAGDGGLKQGLAEINERLAALDSRVTSAANAAGAAAKAASESDAVAGNTLQAFSRRLDTLGDTPKATDETARGQAARIGALEQAAEAERSQLSGMADKLQAIEGRLAAVEQVVGGPGARETAARAIAVSLLKNAVDAGRPFEGELAAVRSAVPGDYDLGSLEEAAADGIPTTARLTAEFPEVAARMAATLRRVDTGNSMADKLLNNMRSLVSVRATGAGAGAGPMGALGEMEDQVRSGDLDAALETYESLPDAAQEAGKDWAAAARARLAADRLVDQVTADVIEALATER